RSVVEQPHPCKRHHHAVFVGCFNDMVVPDGTAGLNDVLDAGFSRPLHIIAEGEEGVGAACDAGEGCDPVFFLLRRQRIGAHGEGLLPDALRQHVLILVGEIYVDGVIPVRAANVLHELQAQHLGMVAEPPGVRLGARQAGAVDAALLACSHADGLSVLHVADGVGLGVFQGDEGHDHVPLGRFRQVLVLRDKVGEERLIDLKVVPPLLEGDAERVLVLLGGGDVVRVDLHDVVIALLLGFQYLQGFVGVAGGDDAVGHLIFHIPGGGGVAHVGEGRPVPVGAQPVRTP
ncbi:acetyl-CoA carboxylase, carboxyltransferase subunit beta, partial [Dysosmobacter welbionis]